MLQVQLHLNNIKKNNMYCFFVAFLTTIDEEVEKEKKTVMNKRYSRVKSSHSL